MTDSRTDAIQYSFMPTPDDGIEVRACFRMYAIQILPGNASVAMQMHAVDDVFKEICAAVKEELAKCL